MQKQKSRRIYSVRGSKKTPADLSPSHRMSDAGFWRWGDDNLFPHALALMSRRSTIHRRIINDKADYISGRGFTCNGDILHRLGERANGNGETLRQVLNKLAFDKSLFGNAFLEIVTDKAHSFLSLYHQDASLCRVARDEKGVVMHHDWAHYKPSESVRRPLFPDFEKCDDGYLRSFVHYKDYEPTFRHYGVPSYIAGMNVSTIAYKTDKWNIARLDNSFQLSGVMMIDGGVDDPRQAEEIMCTAQQKFAGHPGQVMFMIKDCDQNDTSRFIPISSSNEGDWKDLHDQATGDIVVAHSWFRSLSGLDYSGGFSASRIVHEYDIALRTVITGEQEELLEPIRRVIELVLGVDASSLKVINRPPTELKPHYMKVWEARKADGMEYDPDDPAQQLYLGQIDGYEPDNAQR